MNFSIYLDLFYLIHNYVLFSFTQYFIMHRNGVFFRWRLFSLWEWNKVILNKFKIFSFSFNILTFFSINVWYNLRVFAVLYLRWKNYFIINYCKVSVIYFSTVYINMMLALISIFMQVIIKIYCTVKSHKIIEEITYLINLND